MIDRALLRYFLAVVDTGSFSRAAAQARVSQPTVSAAITRLEALLGTPVFDRSSRRVALTPAGARLVAPARRIEAEFAEAERAAADVAPRRLIRLGVASTVPVGLLEAVIAPLVGYDSDSVEVVERRPGELAALLERGRVDVVLGPLSPSAARTVELYEEPYLLALPGDHRLAALGVVDAADCEGETMMVRRSCEALPLVSQFFTARGVRPFMAARSASDERIAALVRAGLGLTVMPRSLGGEGIALKPLAGFDHVRRVGFTLEPGEHGRLERSEGFARMLDAARGWTASEAS